MAPAFNALKLTDRVYWVGALDWGLRNFHGYLTSRGTTYNAYLIDGTEPVLIDAVKGQFKDEMMERISSVMDPRRIRHIISNHAEMDHSGSLPQVVQDLGGPRVYASQKGCEALEAHFHWGLPVAPVKNGQRLTLGDVNLSFVETRMLHWPDSMFTWLENDKVLFTNDGFGMHLATSERFARDVPKPVLEYEAAKYYANILAPYSNMVKGLLAKFPTLGLDPELVAPDHGPIWDRGNFSMITDLYSRWAGQAPSNKAVVVYDTMWKSTEKMALAVGSGLAEQDVKVKIMPLEGSHRSDVATEILDAGALLVGSPTINNQLYPTVIDVMTYLKGLRFSNLVGAAFGSYGWSGESIKYLDTILEEMKVKLVAEGLKVQYVPTRDDLSRCRDLGKSVAAALKANLN